MINTMSSRGFRLLAYLSLLLSSILWAYWPTLSEIAQKWSHDPQYSHGYLVPMFALFLLWWRRSLLPERAQGSRWGISLLLVALGFRFAGAIFFFDWFDAFSLLPLLAGIVLLLGGWPALRWSWPAIGFLFFMMPLPYRLETGLAYPLQRIATEIATYTLQTLGLPALAEGNTILIHEIRIGVVEACSGLGMLLLFFALAVGMALVVQRRLVDKAVIVASAAPIAVLANVIRITVTALLHVTVGSKWADLVFHDLAGWLMMPLALGMLGIELWLLSRVLVDLPVSARKPSSILKPALGEYTRRRQAVLTR